MSLLPPAWPPCGHHTWPGGPPAGWLHGEKTRVCLAEQLSSLQGKGSVPSLSLPSLMSFLLLHIQRGGWESGHLLQCWAHWGRRKSTGKIWQARVGGVGASGEQPSWFSEWLMMWKFSPLETSRRCPLPHLHHLGGGLLWGPQQQAAVAEGPGGRGGKEVEQKPELAHPGSVWWGDLQGPPGTPRMCPTVQAAHRGCQLVLGHHSDPSGTDYSSSRQRKEAFAHASVLLSSPYPEGPRR